MGILRLKMLVDNNTQAFFSLVKAGLWEQEVQLSFFDKIDFGKVLNLAEEQSVVGLVAAGLEHVIGIKVPKEDVLQFVGQALQLEQRNQAMNFFIGATLEKFHEAGIEAVLIKGQGVAQCYAKPEWRSAGDVDLLLNEENYEKGKAFLKGISETEPEEYSFNKEYITTIGCWCLELHGSLRCGLSAALNREVDAIQKEICDNHHVRYWEADGKQIPLPEENEDVMVIFTHFIKHFYKGGLGIRQICDWCRLLWTYRSTIDVVLLEKRLRAMGLLMEWKAFAAYAVDYLGMPSEAMPLYDGASKWKSKAEKVHTFIIASGNFGHNVDGGYFRKYPFLIRKTISMWRRVGVLLRHSPIFPWHSITFMPHVLFTGLSSAAKGE